MSSSSISPAADSITVAWGPSQRMSHRKSKECAQVMCLVLHDVVEQCAIIGLSDLGKIRYFQGITLTHCVIWIKPRAQMSNEWRPV